MKYHNKEQRPRKKFRTNSNKNRENKDKLTQAKPQMSLAMHKNVCRHMCKLFRESHMDRTLPKDCTLPTAACVVGDVACGSVLACVFIS